MQPPKDFHDQEGWQDFIEDSCPNTAIAYLITAGFIVLMGLALYGLGALLGVAP